MPREPSRIMRQNPVPPGRYWVDVLQENLAVWNDLKKRNGEAIQIDYQEVTRRDPTDVAKGIDYWLIVFLTAPISWPKGLPPPNTAPAWVTKREDVYQRPPDARTEPWKSTKDVVSQWLDEYAIPAWGVTWKTALMVGGAYYLLTRRR